MNAIAEKLHLLQTVAPNDALLASMLDKVLGAVADQYRQKLVSFHYHQEETVGNVGYFRVRCTLILHEGGTGVAQAHAPVDAFAVLGEIEKRLSVA